MSEMNTLFLHLSSIFPSLSDHFHLIPSGKKTLTLNVIDVWQVLERSAGDDDDDERENWGKEPRAQKAPGWALKALDEEEKEPRLKQKTCTQRQRGLRPVSLWCPCLAWILCVFLSICCLVTSAALGNR